MSKLETKRILLEEISELLRKGEMPEDKITSLASELNIDDVTWLMGLVASLNGPQDFMNDIDEYDAADNARSEIITKGFFLFVDLISALIRKLGDPALAQAERFSSR